MTENPTNKYSLPPKQVEPIEDSESSEEDDQTFRFMAMAQLLKSQPNEEDEKFKLIKTLQAKNAELLAMKTNIEKQEKPYKDSINKRLDAIERLIVEQDRRTRYQDPGSMAMQMMTMMMMNPSKLV